MVEQLKSKRVFFPLGKQTEFLLQSKVDLECTWKNLAKMCRISVRSLNDWRHEKISMTLFALKRICQRRKVNLPKVTIRDPYWYTTKGASVGGMATVKKYGRVGGDEIYRKEKWRDWWQKEGRFKPSKIIRPSPFKKSSFSEELAEFVGIVLGDGGISEHQVTVTLNGVTDKKYLTFVKNLIKKLFCVPIGFYADKRSFACRVVISRKALVDYLVDVVGLKRGNKVRQQVDIPVWIKENRRYSIACVRGLIDTDGCAIIHQYFSKGKKYRYKKVGFTSRSYPLLKSVSDTLFDLKIKNRISKDGWNVRIEARKDVERYFELVGTNNPKHRGRFMGLQ